MRTLRGYVARFLRNLLYSLSVKVFFGLSSSFASAAPEKSGVDTGFCLSKLAVTVSENPGILKSSSPSVPSTGPREKSESVSPLKSRLFMSLVSNVSDVPKSSSGTDSSGESDSRVPASSNPFPSNESVEKSSVVPKSVESKSAVTSTSLPALKSSVLKSAVSVFSDGMESMSTFSNELSESCEGLSKSGRSSPRPSSAVCVDASS